MPTPTITLPNPPKILSGKEIYDHLMSQIDPELVSGNLPALKEKYKNETAKEKEARRIRYNQSFAKYYEMFEAYVADMNMRIHRYHRESMKSVEEISRSEDGQGLQDLEAAMFKLT